MGPVQAGLGYFILVVLVSSKARTPSDNGQHSYVTVREHHDIMHTLHIKTGTKCGFHYDVDVRGLLGAAAVIDFHVSAKKIKRQRSAVDAVVQDMRRELEG